MPVVSLDGLSFSGLEWTFQLLPSKDTETITCSCSMIKLQACWSLTGYCEEQIPSNVSIVSNFEKFWRDSWFSSNMLKLIE